MDELERALRAPVVVALAGHRPSSRPRTVGVEGDHLAVRMPGVLAGDGGWLLPVAGVGVVLSAGADEPPPDPARAFLDRVTVPYLTATTPLRAANLVVLFASPQRLPRICVRGALTASLPVRASRSAAGAWVDGVALRSQDPVAAAAALVRAGAEGVTAPTRWLTERRPTTADPEQVALAAAAQRRALAAPGLSTALLAAFVATALWARGAHSWWAALLCAAEVALALVLPGALRRGQWPLRRPGRSGWRSRGRSRR